MSLSRPPDCLPDAFDSSISLSALQRQFSTPEASGNSVKYFILVPQVLAGLSFDNSNLYQHRRRPQADSLHHQGTYCRVNTRLYLVAVGTHLQIARSPWPSERNRPLVAHSAAFPHAKSVICINAIAQQANAFTERHQRPHCKITSGPEFRLADWNPAREDRGYQERDQTPP